MRLSHGTCDAEHRQQAEILRPSYKSTSNRPQFQTNLWPDVLHSCLAIRICRLATGLQSKNRLYSWAGGVCPCTCAVQPITSLAPTMWAPLLTDSLRQLRLAYAASASATMLITKEASHTVHHSLPCIAPRLRFALAPARSRPSNTMTQRLPLRKASTRLCLSKSPHRLCFVGASRCYVRGQNWP